MTGAGSELAGTAGRERVPLIERYREWLPVDARTPVVTLLEGSTPLVAAPRLSERIGIETYLKIEGMNPTGSFKDRGMTVAVSQAKANGAEAIICASTGNTAASTAAYAARAGVKGAVIVPEGKIAQGKLAQALMHGARVIALRGNFDQALDLVKAHRRTPRGRARQLDQSLPDRGPEDGRVRGLRRARAGSRRAFDPGRECRQHHRLVEGVRGVRPRKAASLRISGRGRRPDRAGQAGRAPGNGCVGNQDRQSGSLAGSARRAGGIRRPDRFGDRQRDPGCAELASVERGSVLRAGISSCR